LQQIRPTAPLFDCASYTRHLEFAYTAIYDRFHAGLPPDHIHIPR
jgi:predicted O-linked N-acetylglucosamine transferase (SPINDLY family)